MLAVSGHRKDGPLFVGSTMLPAAGEAIAHRYLNRFSPFFELHGGRTVARRSAVVGKRVSSVAMMDRRNGQLPKSGGIFCPKF